MKDIYFKQAQLLLQILPEIHKNPDFALKGGTAINFFFRDIPRLSVDIDLTYLPVENREFTLKKITDFLNSLSVDIKKRFFGIKIIKRRIQDSTNLKGLIINFKNVTVKIEPNLIIRGSVYPPIEKELVAKAQELFELNVITKTVSHADLYGGKICAALDRQHPRDLFDIKLLIDNEGFIDNIKTAFIVYLISHPRPMIEILNPSLLPIDEMYYKEFIDMAYIDITLAELLKTRHYIIQWIKKSLNKKEKHFILSVKEGNPEWELIDIKHIQLLPAVRWKLKNIKKMSKSKHKKAIEKLKNYLEI
ncbi:MAG: nucleotidyl transferase AbiEii/AbiGii toxin family protein [Spirochaetes bacterium]|nr:nucleotidyl transferase AbiEii/AbiGii toxin family protein [Spirochaetota bacterium]